MTKKCFAVALSVASMLACFATEPVASLDPVLTEGKQWNISPIKQHLESEPTVQIAKVIGDTVINDLPCKKIYYMPEGTDEPVSRPQVWCENGSKVSQYEVMRYDTFTLMYDPGASEGDKLEMYGEVKGIQTINICGVDRRVVVVSSRAKNPLGYDDYWIEGIGPVYGTLWAKLPRPTCENPLNYWRINACYDNGKKIFDLEEFEGRMQQILAIEGIESDNDDTPQPIYDLLGRRVENPLPGQIYIRNGKKYVETK